MGGSDIQRMQHDLPLLSLCEREREVPFVSEEVKAAEARSSKGPDANKQATAMMSITYGNAKEPNGVGVIGIKLSGITIDTALQFQRLCVIGAFTEKNDYQRARI